MFKFLAVCMLVLIFACLTFRPVTAVLPPPITDLSEPDSTAPILISSIYTQPGDVFIELHNQTATAINLNGWSLLFSDGIAKQYQFNFTNEGYILPDSFLALSENDWIAGTENLNNTGFVSGDLINSVSLSFTSPDSTLSLENQITDLPAMSAHWYQRKSSGLSGVFADDFSTDTTSTKLRNQGFYNLPADIDPRIKIVEILAHAKDCPPNNPDPSCHDYLKLYVPPDIPESVLAQYRLRTDSSSSSATSANTFLLANQATTDEGFMTIQLKDDGGILSLTDSGGYVWLEDLAGVKVYAQTVINYPTSSSHQGESWALDAHGTWRWSSSPQPNGPNIFPSPPTPVAKSSSLIACRPDQFRNLATNRCKLIVSTASTLVPCQAGQERNPATNRCRTVVTADNSLKPCATGQERNPDTNRCRKIAADVLASSTPPALNNQADNVATGSHWWVAAFAGVGVASYGVYEWRSEIWEGIKKVKTSFSKSLK